VVRRAISAVLAQVPAVRLGSLRREDPVVLGPLLSIEPLRPLRAAAPFALGISARRSDQRLAAVRR